MAGNNNRKKSRSKTNNEIKNKNSKNLSKQLTSSKASSGNSNRRRIEEEDEGFLSENKSELIFILISVVFFLYMYFLHQFLFWQPEGADGLEIKYWQQQAY